MPSLDTTIVSIGISALMDSFHVSETAAQWVSTAYLLALAIVIPRSAGQRSALAADAAG